MENDLADFLVPFIQTSGLKNGFFPLVINLIFSLEWSKRVSILVYVTIVKA